VGEDDEPAIRGPKETEVSGRQRSCV
jgi:hypothetical protein